LVGYSMGAAVALHAAAVLPPSQIAGVGVVGGWTPMRANGGNVTTGGNRMIYETHALIPRLGLFAGREHEIPYDYDELLAAVAPRPALIYTQKGNRFADYTQVAAAVNIAKKAWVSKGAEDKLQWSAPDAPSDFSDPEIAAVLEWISAAVIE